MGDQMFLDVGLSQSRRCEPFRCPLSRPPPHSLDEHPLVSPMFHAFAPTGLSKWWDRERVPCPPRQRHLPQSAALG